MTPDEAILILKRDNPNNITVRTGHEDLFDRRNEAFSMAIKALEQEPILVKIKDEIEQTEINGHIRDVECFRAGINVAINVIDKYIERSGEE